MLKQLCGISAWPLNILKLFRADIGVKFDTLDPYESQIDE